MVVFVGHTLLLGGVGLDVNDIAYMVVDEEGGHLDGAMFYDPYRYSMSTQSPGTIIPLNPRLNIWRVRAR